MRADHGYIPGGNADNGEMDNRVADNDHKDNGDVDEKDADALEDLDDGNADKLCADNNGYFSILPEDKKTFVYLRKPCSLNLNKKTFVYLL